MSGEDNRNDWRVYFALGAAVIVGCYLRLRNVEVNGLWLDEVFSVTASDPDNNFFDVYKRTLSDVHPPAYQILLWMFYKVFGYAEMTGRYLSVFFGVLLVPAIFYLGRQLFDQRVGLFSAGLAAINFYLVSYSQETRSYSLLAFLVVLSFIFFIIALRRSTIFNVGVYAVVVAIMVNTHYFGFLPAAAQLILFFLFNGKESFQKKLILKFFMAAVFVILTLVPSALYILNALARKGTWVPVPNDQFFVEMFSLYFGSLSLSIIAAILIVFGLADLIKKEDKRKSLQIIVVWVSVCVVVPYIRSLYYPPVLTMRNLIVVLPAILVVLGYGLNLVRERVVLIAIVLVVFCFSMTPLFTSVKPAYTLENQFHPKSQMRDVVRVMAGKCSGCSVYSYLPFEFKGYAKVLGLQLNVKGFDEVEDDLESAVQPFDFFILSTRGIARPDTDYMKKHGFHMIKEIPLGDSSLDEYRSDPR